MRWPSLTERFWSRVEKGGAETCWPWRGAKNADGYGKLTVEGGRSRAAHRVAWELTNGPIPDGLFACHKCDNPECCNPHHLFLGTQTDNMRDMVRKGRKPDNSGELNSIARLTANDVAAIRGACRARSKTHAVLAREYGVSKSLISKISRGAAWKSTPGAVA